MSSKIITYSYQVIYYSEQLFRKPPVANEEKTKTINARAQFIKSLLYTMYDQDIADNPRKYFENPDSEISRLFQAKNIKAPSGRTVQAWLNMVDIPFIDEKP